MKKHYYLFGFIFFFFSINNLSQVNQNEEHYVYFDVSANETDFDNDNLDPETILSHSAVIISATHYFTYLDNFLVEQDSVTEYKVHHQRAPPIHHSFI